MSGQVNDKLNYYLPFKLHGSRIAKALHTARHAHAERYSLIGDETHALQQLYQLHERSHEHLYNYDDVYEQQRPTSMIERALRQPVTPRPVMRRMPSAEQRVSAIVERQPSPVRCDCSTFLH
jgi:hypothetical protein